jgi:class 3 adenylate cyclase
MDQVEQVRPNDVPEDGHVLFIDVVGYTKLPMDQQLWVMQRLVDTVSNTPEFRRAQSEEQLIRLPTGDGMALVFFRNPVAAVQCALELAAVLRRHADIGVRMGLHSGPVFRLWDINQNRNVAGGGINLAQRVMDAGDQGHILLSQTVAANLIQLGHWKEYLQDLGEHAVKHGTILRIFNLCKEDVGRSDWPSRLKRRDVATGGPALRDLLRQCRELFKSFDEFRGPESLRASFRLGGLDIYEHCVSRSATLDFDQLLDCLKRSGCDYEGQALVQLLNLLAASHREDYRRQRCEELRDNLERTFTSK